MVKDRSQKHFSLAMGSTVSHLSLHSLPQAVLQKWQEEAQDLNNG